MKLTKQELLYLSDLIEKDLEVLKELRLDHPRMDGDLASIQTVIPKLTIELKKYINK